MANRIDENSVRFMLKEAKEYYKYLHTLTEAGLADEWNKVTKELNDKFESIKAKPKRKSSTCRTSSSARFV